MAERWQLMTANVSPDQQTGMSAPSNNHDDA